MAAPPHIELSGDTRPAAAAARDACLRAGVSIASVAAGFDVNLASPDGAMRDWSLKHYQAAGRFAAQLGAPYLVVHPGRRHPFKPAPFDAAREWVIAGLTRIAEAMRDEGVRPVLENTPSTILDTAEECADVVRAVGADRLGVCYDVANGLMVEDPGHGLRTVAELLQLVHVSDATGGRLAARPDRDRRWATSRPWPRPSRRSAIRPRRGRDDPPGPAWSGAEGRSTRPAARGLDGARERTQIDERIRPHRATRTRDRRQPRPGRGRRADTGRRRERRVVDRGAKRGGARALRRRCGERWTQGVGHRRRPA